MSRKREKKRKGKAYFIFIVYFKINTLFPFDASNYKNTGTEHCMYNNVVKKCEMTGGGEGGDWPKCEKV